ncbi:hypothetical protein [Paenibacillus lignilyticus]|uniref:Uncharacterized protein n=1 Tax=Paenibacillus lignilyticus TaxID=1172615 RepID=A0ABS5CA47_9BACL|nr:hypothetical protein [Paenibacillus lignilyticus]MBP3962809.1 hypothetical protein [Paenibacillus lignilyticus]
MKVLIIQPNGKVRNMAGIRSCILVGMSWINLLKKFARMAAISQSDRS